MILMKNARQDNIYEKYILIKQIQLELRLTSEVTLTRKKYSRLSAYKNAGNKSMFELVNIDLVYISAL